jgi:ketosteroid isomerase-like protein
VVTQKVNMTEAERREIRARNRQLLEKYMGSEGMAWWEEGAVEAGWFANDFLFQIPFAQRGLPVTYTDPDYQQLFKYLHATLPRFDVKWQKIYDMVDPYTFWMEYYGDGECTWCDGGHYEQLEVTFVRLDEQGRLKRYVEHFDPVRVWRAAGKTIPRFDYNEDRLRSGMSAHIMPPDSLEQYIERRIARDARDEAAVDLSGMSEKEISEIRERNRALLHKYMGSEGLCWWEDGAVEAGYFCNDFIMELPNAWPGFARTYPEGEWQKQVGWLNRTVLRFDVLLECLYDTADPYAFWMEYYGDGAVSWGQGGPYSMLEVTFVRLDENGRLKRYREHFDASGPLETSGAWRVPTLDYNEDRKRNGLPPHNIPINTREDYVRQRIADAARGIQL